MQTSESLHQKQTGCEMKTVFTTEVSISRDADLLVRGSVMQSGSPFMVTEVVIDEVVFDDGSGAKFCGELTDQEAAEAEDAIGQAWMKHLIEEEERGASLLEDEHIERMRGAQ